MAYDNKNGWDVRKAERFAHRSSRLILTKRNQQHIDKFDRPYCKHNSPDLMEPKKIKMGVKSKSDKEIVYICPLCGNTIRRDIKAT